MESDFEHGLSAVDVEIEDDTTYQRQLRLFAESSVEKGIELLKIGEILAGLKKRGAMLDVGAGGGDLTIPLSSAFRTTTVVEPNALQIADFQKKRPEIECIHDSWDTVDLGERHFDFILCSHVLYYMSHDQWFPATAKMYSHLAPGGRLAVVIQSPMGQMSDFFNHFTRYDAPIVELWQQLEEEFGEHSLEARYFLNDIRTESLEDMVDIGLFLLCDRRFREQREEIAAYMEANQKVPGGYRMVQDDLILSMEKS